MSHRSCIGSNVRFLPVTATHVFYSCYNSYTACLLAVYTIIFDPCMHAPKCNGVHVATLVIEVKGLEMMYEQGVLVKCKLQY